MAGAPKNTRKGAVLHYSPKCIKQGCSKEHPLIFALGRRGGCLPDGEARGRDRIYADCFACDVQV